MRCLPLHSRDIIHRHRIGRSELSGDLFSGQFFHPKIYHNSGVRPMPFTLSARSRSRLAGVHPVLVGVVNRAIQISPVDFMVTEGLRTPQRQAELVRAGASQTLNSRHLTGHAVDLAALVDGAVRWDWPLYPRIAGAMKAAAAERGVALIWGGDWKSLRDGPHFELDRRVFP